jgi:multimeric flavodoxin WrbA
MTMPADIEILGISGSPRRHGNTEQLLDAFIDGAASAGAKTEKILLKGLAYAPCRGCNACHKNGTCVLDDDAPPLFDKILEADAIALASPIYSMGITAELKGLIDRSQYIWAQKFILKTRFFTTAHTVQHKGIFISTAGSSWDNVFDSAFPMITAFFNTMGFEYYDNIIANNLDVYHGIGGHPTALNDARTKGEEVVRAIKMVREKGHGP